MRSELLIGLAVADVAAYAEYRSGMMPLLRAAGGRFRFDCVVPPAEEDGAGIDINRIFVIEFPSAAAREGFFADSRYVAIRRRLFDRAVSRVVVIADSSA